MGPGTYRTRVIYNDIYFNDGVYLKLTQNAKAMEAVLDVIRKTEGVWRVYRKEELSATDPLTRAPALSHYEGRSGDIKMLGRAYWITSIEHDHARHRASLRHARAADPVRLRHQEGRVSRSRPRRSTWRRRWRS